MRVLQQVDWLAIAAPLTLALAAVLVLLVDAFAGPPRSHRAALVPSGLTVLAIAGAAVPAALLVGDPRSTFCVERALEGPAPCSFVVDPFTLVVWAIVLFGTGVVALIATASVREGRTPQGEWHFLLLCSSAGALTLAASRDLVTLLVALEVVSLPAFALVGLRRGVCRAAGTGRAASRDRRSAVAHQRGGRPSNTQDETGEYLGPEGHMGKSRRPAGCSCCGNASRAGALDVDDVRPAIPPLLARPDVHRRHAKERPLTNRSARVADGACGQQHQPDS